MFIFTCRHDYNLWVPFSKNYCYLNICIYLYINVLVRFAVTLKFYIHVNITVNIYIFNVDCTSATSLYMNHYISFSEDRIRNGMKKLQKAKQGTTQGRLDSFFSVVSTSSSKRKVSWSEVGELMYPNVDETKISIRLYDLYNVILWSRIWYFFFGGEGGENFILDHDFFSLNGLMLNSLF